MFRDNAGLLFLEYFPFVEPFGVDRSTREIVPANEDECTEACRNFWPHGNSNVCIVRVPILADQSLVKTLEDVVIVVGNFVIVLRRYIHSRHWIPGGADDIF